MDRPPPDPIKLLEAWMEWERGEMTPGRVMANFKTGGLRQLLEAMAAEAASVVSAGEGVDTEGAPASETWKPVV